MCTILLGNSAVSASINPRTSYIGNNFESTVAITKVKPEWTLSVDLPADDIQMGKEGVIAVGDDRVYAIAKGQLVGINVLNGKIGWKFGSKLEAPVLYHEGRIYVSSEEGIIYALDAKTGDKRWASTVKCPDVQQFVVDGEQLFVLNHDLQAYDLEDGEFQWRDDYSEWIPGPLLITDSVIVTEMTESGAYMYSILRAFDRKTGKEAWNLMNHNLPIDWQVGTVLSQRAASVLSQVPLTTLDTIDLATGGILKTVEYNPNKIDPKKEEFASGGRAWIADDRVYIDTSEKVFGYPADTDPTKVTRDSYIPTGGTLGQARFAAGPHSGRLIYTNGQNIYGVKLANKATVYYNSGLTSPIARFDLIGQGMYVAQSDGNLVVLDLITAKGILQMQTYGRVFGPTLPASGMIVVQTKGKLLAFKEPKSLIAK